MLIKEATRGVASYGKSFLTLILRDATGEIDTKLWDASKEDESVFTPEQIVKLTGEVNQFRGKAQLKIFSIRPAQTTDGEQVSDLDRKSTRLNSSHVAISYAVFCLKKKSNTKHEHIIAAKGIR